MKRTIKVELMDDGIYKIATLYDEKDKSSYTYGIGLSDKEAIGDLIINSAKHFNLQIQDLTPKAQYG